MLFLISSMVFVSMLKLNIAQRSHPVDVARNALLKDILNNYHRSVQPGYGNETLMLYVKIDIQHFDFREKSGAFHLVGLLHVKWRDPMLVWNPESYGNLSHILINKKSIWIPDLEFFNNAAEKRIQKNHNGFVSVKNDGVVFCSDSIEVYVFCSADMKDWPHDKHKCEMKLGLWTFNGFEVDIMHFEPNSTMTFSSIEMKNMEYKITNFNATHETLIYACCPEPYVSMLYYITFKRESSYAVIFRMPALTIIMFTLIALKMEPSRTEKLWLNVLSFMLISFQLIYFARNIGHFHGTPNIDKK